VRATVFFHAIPARDPAARVGCPPALSEGIQAETREKIGSALGAVATCAESSDQTGTHVQARRSAHPQAGFDAAGTGEKPVDPALELPWLLRKLGVCSRHKARQ
jgi:hypothetical protein